MTNNLILKLILIFDTIFTIFAINHWFVNIESGKILQKIDSPFFLREPNNLIAFLDQIKHNEIIENTIHLLTEEKKRMVEQINHSIQFGMELIKQSKCAMEFYKIENSITYVKISKEYLKRISLKKKPTITMVEKNVSPFCWRYTTLKAGICSYDHLESLVDTRKLNIEPEKELQDSELEFNSDYFVSSLLAGLEENPNSWKYHTLSSYYWRMKGDAHQAAECAKRGVMLAPRRFKDIPLLSLGIILWRAEKFAEAEILFSAAVDHAPEIPENQFALGTVLAMTYQNRSMEHLELAKTILPNIYGPKLLNIQNVLKCVDSLNKKTASMYKKVDVIKKEVNDLKDLKNVLSESHNKLIQQQIYLFTIPFCL